MSKLDELQEELRLVDFEIENAEEKREEILRFIDIELSKINKKKKVFIEQG